VRDGFHRTRDITDHSVLLLVRRLEASASYQAWKSGLDDRRVTSVGDTAPSSAKDTQSEVATPANDRESEDDTDSVLDSGPGEDWAWSDEESVKPYSEYYDR
jgi:hypothetical protein